MKQYLTEAFKQMELIESNEFTYDADGAAELANFMEKDMLDDFEAIIDPEAETVEDLKDSYIGDVICECPVCKSKLFKSPEDIKIEDGEELANIGEPCPYCFETDGFKVIGQVAPFEEVTVETDGSSDVKVEVDGEQIDTNTDDDEPTARHAKDNEDLEDSQRFPVEGTKQVDLRENAEPSRPLTYAERLKRKYPELNFEADENGHPIKNDEDSKQKSKRHAKDNEDLEDSQRYPIKSPVGTKGLKESTEESEQDRKLKLARKMRLARHKKDNEDLEDSQRYPIKSPAPAQTGLAMMEGMLLRDKLKAAFPGVFNFEDRKEESLKEGMEDISITTDDQVIKVKATPRADKEAIQPVSDETKDVIESDATEEPIPVEEIPETEEDVEITDFDEEAFDELGESYLKRVYDNVSSFRTTDGSISGNKLILEGVITFNSGKSAKTKFVFESKTITKSGKVKLKGLNEHISSNKNSFTLTGTIKGTKLLSESLNYNYGARSDAGKMKRLYGTVKRNIK